MIDNCHKDNSCDKENGIIKKEPKAKRCYKIKTHCYKT